MTYELLKAETNGTTNYLLTRDGKVISRWPTLCIDGGVTGLNEFDAQVDAAADLSDYQDDLDAGRFKVTVITREEY